MVIAQTRIGTVTADEALRAEAARHVARTSNDDAAMERQFGSDLMCSLASTAVDTKARYIDLMRSGWVQSRRMTPNADMLTRTYSCVAIVSGTAECGVGMGGKDLTLPLRCTTVWAERQAGLQFVSRQSTSIPAKTQ